MLFRSEKEDASKYANAGFLEKLLPILDNFELGLNAARNDANDSAIFKGMDMVSHQLQDFLNGVGVETVKAEGEPFDPNLHEAVAQEESATVAEGFVVRQLRRGYKLRDRLLRPATVVVSKVVRDREEANDFVAGLRQARYEEVLAHSPAPGLGHL